MGESGSHKTVFLTLFLGFGTVAMASRVERHLTEMAVVEDKAVPILCLTGMPIVGDALESPFFCPIQSKRL